MGNLLKMGEERVRRLHWDFQAGVNQDKINMKCFATIHVTVFYKMSTRNWNGEEGGSTDSHVQSRCMTIEAFRLK